MKITHIEIPIYDMQLTVVLDDWDKANDRFKLTLEQSTIIESDGLTIHDSSDIYLLLKSEYKSCIFHELYHVISAVCVHTEMKPDPNNDEALAYLQEYLGKQIAEFIGYAK